MRLLFYPVEAEFIVIKLCTLDCFTVLSGFLAKHLDMLLKEAELKVDDLTTAVVHVTYTASSETKVKHTVTNILLVILKE